MLLFEKAWTLRKTFLNRPVDYAKVNGLALTLNAVEYRWMRCMESLMLFSRDGPICWRGLIYITHLSADNWSRHTLFVRTGVGISSMPTKSLELSSCLTRIYWRSQMIVRIS